MRTTPLMLALAAAAAMAALPSLAAAQSYGPAPDYDQQTYQQQQDAYQLRLQRYNEDRAAYDQQQRYRQDRSWDRRDDRGDLARQENMPCAGPSGDRAATGGIIGALAGAAIGSNLAERGSRTEGAVLGAVAGGVIGAGVADSTARCDGRGYYYSYNQTVAYREPGYDSGRSNGRYGYDHYQTAGCRLVVVPARWDGHGEDSRYARVCPDGSGRYRLTE